MGRRGPRPQPSALRVIRGRSHHGRRAGEPQPERGRPNCPTWLPESAKDEWHRVVPLLDGMGVLTKIDRAALEGYCVSYAKWRDAEAKLMRFGPLMKPTSSGYIPQSPYVALARQSLEEMRRFMQEFGMTPSSRTRIGVLPGQEEPDDFGRDELDFVRVRSE